MRKLIVVCLFLCGLTTLGYAQLPSGNIFVGYSYLNTDLSGSGGRNSLNGWAASGEYKVFPFVELVADFSAHYGPAGFAPNGACTVVVGGTCSTDRFHADQYSFLAGPRISFSAGKFRPFVHALVGGGYLRENAPGSSLSNTTFAYALGGGIDYHLIPRVSWRIQADVLETRFFSITQNNARISTGIVVHF